MAVPKLRFKEFNEDWKENSLKNCVASIDSGWSPLCESNPSEIDEWGVLKTTAVDWDGFKSDFNKKLPLQLSPRLEIEVKPLDILVTRAGPTERVGVVSVVPMTVRPKLMISDKLIRLKVNEQTDASFLGITLSSAKCQSQLQSKTSGLAKSQTNISQKILSDVLLMLPPKTEQTKIASFLSAVDEKISQLSQKHSLLSQYKQGMMQKLFSQQIRFKADDGSEFGEWKSCNVGSFLKVKSGLSFKAEEYTTEEEVRLLQIENVGYGSVKWTHNVKYVPQSYLKLHQDLVLKEGDLVLALNRPVTNDKLKIAKLTKLDSPSILYQRVGKLELKDKNSDRDFIFQIFQKEVKNYVLNSSIGSDQPFISTTDLYKHHLMLPSKEEQTKIANFLSAIDQKIEVVAQQIEQAKTWKKGLLQQMFV